MKIGIIPLRAGSKGIPGKNKKALLGRPLFSWVLGEAILSRLDLIYVYSDDGEILAMTLSDYAWSGKVKALERPAETASDQASTESAMLALAESLDHSFDIICLLQATSPLTRAEDIDACIDAVENGGFDSSLSVVKTTRFHWDASGAALDYDVSARPRRQDHQGQLVENGAVYCSKAEAFWKSSCRISGRIRPVEMGAESLTEIDEKEDWPIVEALVRRNLRALRSDPPLPVKALIMDVDGCLTDGSVQVSAKGEKTKGFSLIDGMGLALLRKAGIQAWVMTREDSPIVAARMRKLGIEDYYPGTADKYARVRALLGERGLEAAEVAYLGDDINDLACLLSSGWALCPRDAQEPALAAADIVLKNKGGRGAAREACDFLIAYNQRWKA